MLYIRADMNDTIATGHVMRCLAIADAAKNLGEQVIFILADNQAVSYICDRGYESVVLNTRWDDLESELPVVKEIIKEKQIPSLLVDSYQVTDRYLRELSMLTKVLYIDDINAFYYPVDAVICYAIYWEKFGYEQKYHDVKLYLGPAYTPLRKEFCNIGKKKIKDRVENLLLLSGGNDEWNIMGSILHAVDRTNYKKITVICGKYYSGYEQLTYKYRESGNICICQSVSDMEKYMQEADLAISAGGTTLYELCACGTPTISYALADNQLENVKKMSEDEIIDCAGDVRSDEVIRNILALIEKYRLNPKLRRERSEKMQKLVDGKGTERLIKVWREMIKES